VTNKKSQRKKKFWASRENKTCTSQATALDKYQKRKCTVDADTSNKDIVTNQT